MIRKNISKKQLEFNLKRGHVTQLDFNLYILDQLEQLKKLLKESEPKKEGDESMNA